ncbi:MAG: hypothetical protein IJU12_08310, partial [Clostridia bacterium]|nr:hypothetical protein [Clostridia bacterium]
MKRFLCSLLALTLMLSCFTVPALADYYKQHQGNEATFETLEEVKVNEPLWMEEEYGSAQPYDPALDKYPEGTTYVYRAPGMYTSGSAAVRMNTNLLVYADHGFESKEEAYAYLEELGLIDICNEATGSIVLVTPIAERTMGSSGWTGGWGEADRYAFYILQSVMCNIGGGKADPGYYGGLTYRYLIGIDAGATFINNFIAPEFDFITRIAGLLLIGGENEKVRQVAGAVPVWLVNPQESTVEKYKKANGTDSFGRNGDDLLYYNSKLPLQQVIVTNTEEVDLKQAVHNAYYDLFIHNFRIPVVKAGLYTGQGEFYSYSWNQAPYSLGKRNPIINGVTPDGIHVIEMQGEEFATDAHEYITTWYEFLPEEVLDGTAGEHTIPRILAHHGGGDDPVQAVDELGLLTLAGEKRIAMVAERHASETPGASFMSDSPFNYLSEMAPKLVRYMLDKYPALDPARVYVTGYSMGGSSTNRSCYGDSSLFAAAVNMSGTPYPFQDDPTANVEQFAEIDMPMMLTT